MLFFDPLYLVFMLPAMALMFFAQHRVNSTFKKFSQVPNQQRLTGAEVARRIISVSKLLS